MGQKLGCNNEHKYSLQYENLNLLLTQQIKQFNMDQLTHLVEIHVLPSYFIITIFNNLDMTFRSDFHNK